MYLQQNEKDPLKWNEEALNKITWWQKMKIVSSFVFNTPIHYRSMDIRVKKMQKKMKHSKCGYAEEWGVFCERKEN